MSAVEPSSTRLTRGLSPDAVSSLFQAIGGLRNLRALAAMAACLIIAVLIGALGGVALGRGGVIGSMLTMLVVLLAVYTGVNAAGILLMDQARGNPPRGLVDALVQGLMCIPKLIVLAIGFFLVSLAVFLAIAIVLLVCKIPLLGPVVFTVAFPLAVVVAGLATSGLLLCMFLALPAIWEGATITHAIAQAIAIVRSRIVETFLMLMVVGFLAFVVGLIVFGVLASGLFPTLALSTALLGGGMEVGMGPVGGFGGMMGAGGGYAVAGGIGGGVLWAIAATLVSQVWLLGLNLVYLRVSEGLDANATEATIRERLAEARRKSAEMANKAREAAERARDQARARSAAAPVPSDASTAPPVPPPPAPPSAAVAPPPAPMTPPDCPVCHAPIAADDVFCGACGHRVR
jgi:hypothetical protein